MDIVHRPCKGDIFMVDGKEQVHRNISASIVFLVVAKRFCQNAVVFLNDITQRVVLIQYFMLIRIHFSIPIAVEVQLMNLNELHNVVKH